MEANAPASDADDERGAVEAELATVELRPAEVVPTFPIVGVGASAGGLEALQRFFEQAPLDAGLAYVVVQHLSPDFKSLMEELLARHTRLPIRRVTDGMPVEPDRVYLIPPNADMIIASGTLHLTERDPDQALTLPIDLFLRSLAEDAGPRAVAVILSGSGSDGSRGVRAIHEAGGLVVAQDERTAKFDGMPRSAIETGLVDHVLAPEEIPGVLVEHARTRPAQVVVAPRSSPVDPDGLGPMFTLLRREYGIDFSHYKPSTVVRRVQRRIALSDTPDLPRYLERLELDPVELDALYRDLLIGVTRFFRDSEAFTRLRTMVEPLIQRLEPSEEMRVWVAGCATGEEAYTVGMLIIDAMQRMGRRPLLKLFATDVHRASLEVASAGRYDAEALRAVPPALREAYFQPQGEHLVVKQELRSHIVFAPHNLLRDAPFTRLDLVTCRNLLIYFQPHAQRKVLSFFHFGMKAGGVLLLGPSETPGDLSDEFQGVDEHWKLYRKRRDVRLVTDLRLSAPEFQARGRRPGRQDPNEQALQAAREALIEEFAPPTLIVDGRGALLESLNGASALLSPRDGAPSLNVIELAHRDLKFSLAHGLKRAFDRREPSSFSGVRVRLAGGDRLYDVGVRPLVRGEQVETCVITLRARPSAPVQLPEAPADGDDMDRLAAERIDGLEHELRHAKENLQATIEEMETSNEELQATNEELVASNEELQSTNEELHSVNEELYTVNAEHQQKIAELLELTTDMDNLLSSTEVHTLFLDRELRLRKFTPKVAETFNLLPQDVGRRIDGFTHSLNYDDLLEDVRRVLEGGPSVERETLDRDGRAFLVRILPYQAREGVDGVVITLIDISSLKRAQQDLRASEQRYRSLVRALAAAVWTCDQAGLVAEPQREWEALTGQRWPAYRGSGWLAALAPQDQGRVREAWSAAFEAGELCLVRTRLWCVAHQAHRHVELRAAPVLDAEGVVQEWVATVSDVEEEVRVEQERRRLERHLQGLLDNSPAFIHVKDLQGRYVLVNPGCRGYLGVDPATARGRTDLDLLPLEVAERVRLSDRRVAITGEVMEVEEVLPTAEGERTFLSTKFPLRDDKGEVAATAGIAWDNTERKRAIEATREAVERRDRFLAMLSHELRNPLAALVTATYTLRRPELPAAARARAPEVIQRQADHLARLLDDLLDVARVTSGRFQVRREPIDLIGVLARALEQHKDAFDAAGVALRVDAPEGPVGVEGDATRLQQVLGNLLSNAAKYTPGGGHAELAVSASDGQVVARLRDTGVGITVEQLDRVFELFYQGDSSLDRSAGGLGIGLTLARSIARMHGGDLTVSSEGAGRGAEFTLTLPLVAAPPPATDGDPTRGDGALLRVVLVEDFSDTRELLSSVLEHAGHRVVAAPDGLTAVEAIRQHRPHIALVDVGLPGIDGYEVARRVRAAPEGRAIRLVAVTGYGRPDDRQRALAAGFDDHLVKPLDPDLVLSIVEQVRTRPRRT
ncbi:MAG: PAS domain-containing protein [Planctomycetes bacterium]|nr:PAS domain-containing protein [Planctomycetota bacterium]